MAAVPSLKSLAEMPLFLSAAPVPLASLDMIITVVVSFGIRGYGLSVMICRV